MGKKKSIKVLLLLNIILLLIVITFLIVTMGTKNNIQLSKTIQSSGEKMTDTSRITELENQIDGLNSEHTTYGEYIQTNKAKIATAITNGGVSTSADATADTMATNIATLATNRYNLGVNDGRKGYYTQAQYDANYWTGNTDGANWVINHPHDYSLYTKADYDWISNQQYSNGYNAGASSNSTIYLGTVEGLNQNKTISATNVPNWSSKTSSNFLAVHDSWVNWTSSDDQNAEAGGAISYNASNGVVTVYCGQRNPKYTYKQGQKLRVYYVP